MEDGTAPANAATKKPKKEKHPRAESSASESEASATGDDNDDDEEEEEEESEEDEGEGEDGKLVDDEAVEVTEEAATAEEAAVAAEENPKSSRATKKRDAFPRDLIATGDDEDDDEDDDYDESEESSSSGSRSSSSSSSSRSSSSGDRKHKKSSKRDSKRRHRHHRHHKPSKRSKRGASPVDTAATKSKKPKAPPTPPKRTPAKEAAALKAPTKPARAVSFELCRITSDDLSADEKDTPVVAAPVPPPAAVPKKSALKRAHPQVNEDDADDAVVPSPPVAPAAVVVAATEKKMIKLVPPTAESKPKKAPAKPKKAAAAEAAEEKDDTGAATAAAPAKTHKPRAVPEHKRDLVERVEAFVQGNPWLAGIAGAVADEKTIKCALTAPMMPIMDLSAPLDFIVKAARSAFQGNNAAAHTGLIIPCLGFIAESNPVFAAFTQAPREAPPAASASADAPQATNATADAMVGTLQHSAAQSFSEQANRLTTPKPLACFLHVLARHPLLLASGGGGESASGNPMPLACLHLMQTVSDEPIQSAAFTWNPAATGDLGRVKSLAKTGAPFCGLRAVMASCNGFRIEFPHAFKPADAKLGATRFVNYSGSAHLKAGVVYTAHMIPSATHMRVTHQCNDMTCNPDGGCVLMCATAWNARFFEDAVNVIVRSAGARLKVREAVDAFDRSVEAMFAAPSVAPLARWGIKDPEVLAAPVEVPDLALRIEAMANPPARRAGGAAGAPKKKRKTADEKGEDAPVESEEAPAKAKPKAKAPAADAAPAKPKTKPKAAEAAIAAPAETEEPEEAPKPKATEPKKKAKEAAVAAPAPAVPPKKEKPKAVAPPPPAVPEVAMDEDDEFEAKPPTKKVEEKKAAPAPKSEAKKPKEAEKAVAAAAPTEKAPATEPAKKKTSVFAKPQKPKDSTAAPAKSEAKPAPAAPPAPSLPTQVVTSDGHVHAPKAPKAAPVEPVKPAEAAPAAAAAASDASPSDPTPSPPPPPPQPTAAVTAADPIPMAPIVPMHAPDEDTPPPSPVPAAPKKKAATPTAAVAPPVVPAPVVAAAAVAEEEEVDYEDDAANAAAVDEATPVPEEMDTAVVAAAADADAEAEESTEEKLVPLDSDAFVQEYRGIRMEMFTVAPPTTVAACAEAVLQSGREGNIFGHRKETEKPIECSRHLITFGPYARHHGVATRLLNSNSTRNSNNALLFPNGRRLTVIVPVPGAGENANKIAILCDSSIASVAAAKALLGCAPEGKIVKISDRQVPDALRDATAPVAAAAAATPTTRA